MNTKIKEIRIHTYRYDTPDIGLDRTGAIPTYRPGDTFTRAEGVLEIETEGGIVGQVAGWPRVEGALLPAFKHALLGRDALDREAINRDLKLLSRHYGRLSMGIVDVALWDIAGKVYDAPIYRLLGGSRERLPCYSSTMNGGDSGGLSTPESYGDFAEQCLEMGYRGFKIHPWPGRPISEHIRAVECLGERVGGKMDLMIDPFSYYRTFGEAVKVGQACDAAGFFWLEDLYMDTGVSEPAHRRLRSLLKTPFLQGEHLRGLEQHMNLVFAEATDFVRGDVFYDGITGTMKIAHAAEANGLDLEIHSCGPAQRHAMAAMENSNYYEIVWTHPDTDIPLITDELYLDFKDGIESIDSDGTVGVPQGPGLGVTLNWDWIKRQSIGTETL